MARAVTLFTGQWADLPLEELAEKAASWGYDGIELACWGDHFEVDKALKDDNYYKAKRDLLKKHRLKVFPISSHLAGQVVCDSIDQRYTAILPGDMWGDSDPEGVRQRAVKKTLEAGRAAKKLGVKVANGFIANLIWHLLYSFPPVTQDMVETGHNDSAERWRPVLDTFKAEGIKFGLDANPMEIAFDAASVGCGVEAVKAEAARFGLGIQPQEAVCVDATTWDSRGGFRAKRSTGGSRRNSAFAGGANSGTGGSVNGGFCNRCSGPVRDAGGGAVHEGWNHPGDPLVSIFYSRKDQPLKNRLVTHLGVLQKEGLFSLWYDRCTDPGDDWFPAIEQAIADSNIALLMISADFLDSDFIRREEVPRLLERRQEEGLRVLPIIVGPCSWREVGWLSRMNVMPRDAHPIAGGTKYQIDAQFAAIVDEVAKIIRMENTKPRRQSCLHVGVDKESIGGEETLDAVIRFLKALQRRFIALGANGFDISVTISTRGLTKGGVQ